MASSTPSAPITSSRGPAVTIAGRIYFSTPAAQVRVAVGDLVSPSLLFTLYYLGENYKATTAEGSRRRTGGRRRKNYPRRAQVPKNYKKIRKMSHSAENTLFHIFIH